MQILFIMIATGIIGIWVYILIVKATNKIFKNENPDNIN